MKLKSLYIALGMSAMLSSCVYDDPDCVVSVAMEETFPVSFRIQLSTEGNPTRDITRDDPTDPWQDPGENPYIEDENGGTSSYESGTDFDNKIVSIVPVLYAYTGDATSGELVYTLPVAELAPGTTVTKTPLGGNQYNITAEMKCNDWNKDMLVDDNAKLRLVVYINCNEGDVVNPLDIRNPGDALFYHHGQPDHIDEEVTDSKYFHSIPMFGAANVKFKEEDKMENDEVVKDADGNPVKVINAYTPDMTEISIPILRSMAKIRVLLDEDLNGEGAPEVKLESLYIQRHCVQGYVVPKEWKTCYSTLEIFKNPALIINPINDGSNNVYNEECIIYPQTDKSEDNNYIHKDEGDFYSDSSEKLRFYLPDTYNNLHDGETSHEIYMRLKYTVDGEEHTHLIWFRPQEEWPEEAGLGLEGETEAINYPTGGTPWDIVRNHIYEFKIMGVEEASGDLEIQVSVKDWKYRPYVIEL